MINGMCEDEGMKELKPTGGECQDTRYLLLEEERGIRDTKIKQNYCMKNRCKSAFCIVNSNKACVSTELANYIYNEIEKIRYLGSRL